MPAGVRGGEGLRLENPATGTPMHVVVPPGLSPGDAFLVRPPPSA